MALVLASADALAKDEALAKALAKVLAKAVVRALTRGALATAWKS